MESINLTLEKARQMVEAAIDERGVDYIYERPSLATDCMYVHEHGTEQEHAGCGIGLAFHLAGVPLEELRKHEHEDAGTLVWRLHGMGILSGIEPEAEQFMVRFQSNQDHGSTWGEARDAALDGAWLAFS
jgi:hypothetical protein